MKTHRLLAEASARIVDAVLREGRVLDATLADAFQRHPKWGKRDRSFIAETVFEVVRWRRALAFVADSDATPALCAAQWRRMGHDLPEGWTHPGASTDAMEAREAALADQPRAIRASVPDWLDARGVEELGEATWDAELAALNHRARVFLRVNTLRNDRDEARAWLAGHGVDATPVDGLPEALVLPSGKILPKPLLAEGRVEIQDAGSQWIGHWVDPQPGEVVVDSCAGAGGKTLQLAARMAGRGVLHALDADPRRLVELARRAARCGVRSVRTAAADAATLQRLAGCADRLLIDAPCSGLGTLKRQPDLKWRLKPATLEQLHATQAAILATHPAMLKPGGLLVYATCSILPSENRAAITPLLDSGEFELVAEHTISPAQTGYDGFQAMGVRRRREF